MYIERNISGILKQAVGQFPVVFLTGPRQSGKTTLLRHIFPEYKYVNLEDPELRQWAISQPRDFLKSNPWPLIIDEAQYAPDLFSYIQVNTDSGNRAGMYLLSGSQNFLLMEKISQSLAGRSAVLTLLPFSYRELDKRNVGENTNEIILKGFYPRLFDTVKNVSLFYKSYLNTYVERDVRQLANIGSMNDFIRFMRLCAGRCGQLLNISSLATESGVAYNTCKAWLSYLSTGYIIQLLRPYYRNFNKKIVKSPKLYFTDTGLLAHLLGINSANTLTVHPLRGAIFENLIYCEILKSNMNTGDKYSIWFWRDNHGTEVDYLLEDETKLTAVEVKSGSNFHDEYLGNLRKFRNYNPEVKSFYLIYNGEIGREEDGIVIKNWKEWSLL